INEAKSGHPGIVLGAAPILYSLYANHLNISLTDTNWINRDRFIMSAGHGSALLYSTLYLAGFNLTLDDVKHFRRSGKTPGHPEYNSFFGIEMTTGPLGQGISTAAGLALGSKMLSEKFSYKNTKGKIITNLIDYKVYVLCGDGDLMEGVTSEAISLAGTLKLNNLIVLYDSNDTTLDGKTNISFKENVRAKFAACGWNTLYVKDGSDYRAVDKAINSAKKSNLPTIIEIKTTIGRGSLLEGTNKVHGKPLEESDINQLRASLNVKEAFNVPDYIKEAFQSKINKRVSDVYDKWSNLYKEYITINTSYQKDLNFLNTKELNVDLCNFDWHFDADLREAMRDTNNHVMEKMAKNIPQFIGGSADLGSSTKTYLPDFGDIKENSYSGKNIWFGVREHAMGTMLNGLALAGFRPFGSTFLVFSDYMKPAIRLSSLMKLPVTYIFTHDSVSIGEDGATHQPIEQLAMLRSIPDFNVFRPCDAHEIVGAWNYILNSITPHALVLSRNPVTLLKTTDANKVKYGAYVVRKEIKQLHGIIIATGSEVQTAFYIAEELYNNKHIDIRIVSMPSLSLFKKQPKEYQEEVLPMGYKKIVIEAGSSFGLEGFVYNDKYLITIDHFGMSGTKEEVLEYCDFTYEQIKIKVEKLLS
ncbi:MAG: transketolase, partial [Bacilli bacterium]|nr:transketolase [Bacilli bacterium]